MKRGWIGAATLVAAALAVLPGAALAWRAINGHRVHDLGGGVYEVVGRVGSSASDYWCGAADYAIAALGAAAAQRIYVWRPIGPSQVEKGRKAVQFALSPPPGGDTSTEGYSLTVRRPGENQRAAVAHQFCYDAGFEDFRWRP